MSKRLPRKLAESWRIAWPSVLAGAALGLILLLSAAERDGSQFGRTGRSLGQWLVATSYDLLFAVRADLPMEGVVCVVMDDESHRLLGQEWFKAWDRSQHAWLLDRLRQCGARAAAFDILFDQENPAQPEADRALVEAARRFGRVAFAGTLVPDVYQGDFISLKLVAPFYALRTNAVWGVAEWVGSDRAIRQHCPGSHGVPSLAWRTAELTETNLPAPEAERWMNYYGPPGQVQRISFHRVLQETNAEIVRALSNRVVFVGALYDTGFSGGKGTDDFSTPYTLWKKTSAPGVEVVATTYLNIVRRDWLKRLGLGAESLVLLVLSVALGLGLTALRPAPAAGSAVAVAGVIAVATCVLAWKTHFWFPWLIPCAIQIPVALVWAIVNHSRRLERKHEVLERELAMAGYAPTPFPASPVAGRTAGPQPADLYVPGVTPPPAPPHVDAPPIPDHTMQRRVGHGAYGEVWLAQDAIGSYHAVKIVYRRTFQEDGPYEREFRGLQKFTPISRSHPGFIHILHVGRNNEHGYFYCIMEAGDDERTGPRIDPDTYQPRNLARELARRGRLPPDECVQLGLDLATALHHLHGQQLIHRDIKPSNIVFVNGRPKFADIGLVTDIGGTGHAVTYLGTQGYIPPEGPGTAAADVYGLGKVLYQAATGLECARFPELPTGLPEPEDESRLMRINRVILRACEPDVARRYQTAAELAAGLAAIARPEAQGAEASGKPGRVNP